MQTYEKVLSNIMNYIIIHLELATSKISSMHPWKQSKVLLSMHLTWHKLYTYPLVSCFFSVQHCVLRISHVVR